MFRGGTLRDIGIDVAAALILALGFFRLAPHQADLAAALDISLDVPFTQSSDEVVFSVGERRHEQSDRESRKK